MDPVRSTETIAASIRHDPRSRGVLIVIPCLNEAETIDDVVSAALAELELVGGVVVVVDGGSTDGTLERLRRGWADEPRLQVISNPDRLQSAGVNLAVERFGSSYDYLLRVDAHGGFPPGYARTLIEELDRRCADSVVVKMVTTGRPKTFQAAVARAQNGPVGNGGAAHRVAGGAGSWVSHGHHALFRMKAFQAAGGYDRTFSHNEDAEFDIRFTRMGFKVWLTDDTRFTYFPRASAGALARQYYRFGRGRARTVALHRQIEPRQLAVAPVAPALLLATVAHRRRVLALPAATWVAACLARDAIAAVRDRQPGYLAASGATMVMHAAWSAGFVVQLATSVGGRVASSDIGGLGSGS